MTEEKKTYLSCAIDEEGWPFVKGATERVELSVYVVRISRERDQTCPIP